MSIPLTAPIIRFSAALGISVLTWLWLSIIPPIAVGIAGGLLGILLLAWRFYGLSGACLSMLAISLFVTPPITQSYNDCSYQATIQQADYSRQRLGKSIRLSADNIHCQVQGKPLKLKAQTLIFNDYQRQFRPFTHANIRLNIHSQLLPVRGRLNPYDFDYEKYLHESGIRLQIKSPTILSQTTLYDPITRLRNALAKSIQTHLPPQQAAIVLALIVGNRSALSPQQKQYMQDTGSSHILAISGLHLALVGGWTWLLVQWFWGVSLRLNRYLQPIQAGAIGALFVITLYALVSGFDIPVRRAWLMFSLLIMAWLTLRPINSHSLLLAGCVVVFFDPYALLSVGFYFSFIATAVVLWAARLTYSPIVKVIILQSVITTTLLPITWFVFGTVAPGSFFVNLLIIPWLGLWVLPVAIIANVVAVFADTTWLWQLLSATTLALWQVITWFAQLDLHVSPPTRPYLFAVMIAVGSLLLCLYRKNRRYGLGVLILFLPLPKPASPALVVADSRYTSALIHNGRTAIMLNPGRKYRHINQADKWIRYLKAHHLRLSHVVLSSDKISSVSATQSLRKHFPNANVVTLSDFPLPYPSDFCTPATTDNLSLQTTLKDGNCHANITWFNHVIQLNNEIKDNENALLKSAQLRWKNQLYDAQKLGAITITPDGKITYLRQQKKPWRASVSPPVNVPTAKSPTHVVQQSGAVAGRD